MKYVGINNIKCKFETSVPIKHKKLHFFAYVLLFATVVVSGVGSMDIFSIRNYVSRIVSSWTPKSDDFGKIKFVNFSFTDKSGDGIFMVTSPFKNYYVTNISDTVLSVYGLGDIVVLSPIDGVVQDIIIQNGKCNIAIVNSNVVVWLKDVDYACVDVGNTLLSGDKIAISLDSRLQFSILCDGEFIQLPATNAGDTFFE